MTKGANSEVGGEWSPNGFSLSLLLSPHSALRNLLGWSSFVASAPHTHPITVFPFPFYSCFLFLFLPESFFLTIGGGGGLAGAVGLSREVGDTALAPQ